MADFLTFEPIYQPRIWGGIRFTSKLHRNIPLTPPIGESWDLVDRPEACSIINIGPFAGKTLNEFLQTHPTAIMGPAWKAGQAFPILVKWLDCSDRLSLQVHPPVLVAGQLKGEPKDENWYFVDCEKDANIIAGFKNPISKDIFLKALSENMLEGYLQTLPVQVEDSFYIPSSRIHAIGSGSLILEIQQNSDTTYRVYDWGRVGLDGKSRQLHLEESLQSIDFQDIKPKPLSTKGQSTLLADSPSFRIHKVILKPLQPITFPENQQPRIISVVQGALGDTVSGTILPMGSTALLPYNKFFRFESNTQTTILITDNFAQGCITTQPFVI